MQTYIKNIKFNNVSFAYPNTDVEVLKNLNFEIKKELPDYYLLFIYVFRRNMPLTSIDKIDYKMLEQEKYSFKNRIVESDTKKEKRLIKTKKN